jgi:apolipoprotein N-acyltransferase
MTWFAFFGSSLLIFLAFPNMFWHCGYLGWFAMVPIFSWAYWYKGPRKAFLLYCFFLVQFLTLFWINPFLRSEWQANPGVIVLAVFVFMLFPLFFSYVVWLGSKIANPLVLSLLWVTYEWLTLNIGWLMPINYAVSLCDLPFFIWPARYIGILGISFLLIWFNASLSQAFLGKRWYLISLYIVGVGLLGAAGQVGLNYGTSLSQKSYLTIALIQPAIRTDEAGPQIIDSLLMDAPKTDLIILPELAASQSIPIINQLVLFGAIDHSFRKGGQYNSALLAKNGQITAKYHKTKLIPLMETSNYQASKAIDPVWAGARIGWVGVEICLESLYPEISRTLKNKGAELLVLLANDAWFENTNWAYLHSAYLPFRAVENGIYAVQVNNSGPSAVFDPWGRRLFETLAWERGISLVKIPKVL